MKHEFYNKVAQENYEKGIRIGEEKIKKEIAKKMINQNQKIEFISKITGLEVETIEKL